MKPLDTKARLSLGSMCGYIAGDDAREYTCQSASVFKTTHRVRNQTGFAYTGSHASNSAEYRALAEGAANLGVPELRCVMREGLVPWELNP